MSQWSTRENQIIELNAGSITSKQIADLLEGRTAKAVRHQAEKLKISLTGWVKHSPSQIDTAIGLRLAGFTRPEIEKETGLSEHAQRYYEDKCNA